MKLFRTTDHTTTDDEAAYDANADTAMSQEPVQPVADTRPVSSGLARENEAAAEPSTTTYQNGAAPDQDGGGPPGQPQPTFTPAPATSAGGIATSAGSTVASVRPDPTDEGGDFTRPLSAAVPVNDETPPYDTTPAYGTPPAEDQPATTFPASAAAATGPLDEPAAAFTADEPLLVNSAGMRASWLKVQAEFVDDPQAAVRGAADLTEQAAQALIDALAQRQRQLRESVGGDSAGSGSGGANGTPDTEHLRLLMQRYRTLFNQLCQG